MPVRQRPAEGTSLESPTPGPEAILDPSGVRQAREIKWELKVSDNAYLKDLRTTATKAYCRVSMIEKCSRKENRADNAGGGGGLLDVSRRERFSRLSIIRWQDALVILRNMTNRSEILHSPLHLHPGVPGTLPGRYHVQHHRDHLLRHHTCLRIWLPRPEAQFLVRRVGMFWRIAAACRRSERYD